jgi:glutaminyl-peptide cyclotransferase
MKPKWIFATLLLVATLAAFWFFRPDAGSGTLGIRAHSLTGEILAYGPRPPGSDALDKVKEHLAKELEASGWITRLQEFERDTPMGKVKFSNLRARIAVETTDTWERPVRGILCAHIDSKYFKDKEFLGADDAASACAAVAVIAKHLAETDRDKAEQLELVFFDGEEAFAKDMTILDGLYGSRFYANAWRSRDDKPRFGILMDMIGHKDLRIRIPSDSPKHLADLMFSEAKEQGVGGHFGTAPGEILDDHVPLNLVGIPTIDIIGDFSRKAWWHTTGDSAAIISPESLGISIGVVLGMLDELLGDG